MTKFDLKDRLISFSIEVINLTKKLPQDRANTVLTSQIIRSATSMGANYEEADGARSKKEFISTIGIVKKEAKETKYWLEIIKRTNPKLSVEVTGLQEENEELIKITAKIIINSLK
jgi:four helix bundle protein